jgi:hypothetical protein
MSDQMNDLAADMQGSTSSCDSGGGTPSGSLLESDVNQYLLYCI